MDPQEVLENHNSFAVVGATQNTEKFGYKIYQMLKKHGKVVFPVNPRYENIDGDKCFPSIAAIEEKPEVAVSVVPPRVTDILIETCEAEGIVFLWLQPGTYTEEVLEKARAHGLTVICGACIIDEMDTSAPLEFHFPG
jgi:predicted CoA-binding protein